MLAYFSSICLAQSELPVNLQTAYSPVAAPDTSQSEPAPADIQTAEEWEPWASPLSTAEMAGRVFYVAATGTDDGDGTESNPWKSIQHAVNQLQAGDTLLIGAGIYREAVKLLSSGTAEARITIEGVGQVVLDGAGLTVGLDTNGHDYLTFKNLTVNGYQNGVKIYNGSQFVEVDGLRADGNVTALRIDNASDITVRNAYAVNSNNAFRAVGASQRLLFEDIQAYSSKDIYDGMNPDYKNGDGFIFEATVSDVVFRRIVSANHWDAGFDIKASNVLIENVEVYGCKNNFKMWGENITIVNAYSHHAKREWRSDGSNVEGNGITVIDGSTRIINGTFVDNEDHEISVYANGSLRLENSIVARKNTSGLLYENDGQFSSDRVLWFFKGFSRPDFSIAPTDFWMDPQFADWTNGNYHLKDTSPALDFSDPADTLPAADLEGYGRTVGPRADLGAFELQTVPAPRLRGIAGGDTVQGTVYIEPDPEVFPVIMEVTYFIDGSKHSRVTKRPYTLGGSKGYNTGGLSEGAHALKVQIKISKKETVTFTVMFIVSRVQSQGAAVIPESGPEKKKSKKIVTG